MGPCSISKGSTGSWPLTAESHQRGTHHTPSESVQSPLLLRQVFRSGRFRPWAVGPATATGDISGCLTQTPLTLQWFLQAAASRRSTQPCFRYFSLHYLDPAILGQNLIPSQPTISLRPEPWSQPQAKPLLKASLNSLAVTWLARTAVTSSVHASCN